MKATILFLYLFANLAFGDPKGARPDEVALIKAVKAVGGKSADGEFSPALCEITRDWAKRMASRYALSTRGERHDGFNDGPKARGKRAMLATHSTSAAEVLAATYGFETTLEEHANSCAHGWAGGPKHRSSMMLRHDHFCYSMEKGLDQKYYCAGLFTDDAK